MLASGQVGYGVAALNDFRAFRMVGRTTDGRKWAEFMNLNPEFIAEGWRFIGYLAARAGDWDERHECKTTCLELEPFPEGELDRLLAVVAEADSLKAGQVWRNEIDDAEMTILSVDDDLVAYEDSRRDFYQSNRELFLDSHYLVRDVDEH